MKYPNGFYEVWEEVPPQTNPAYEDQRHVNRAYTLYRLFMAEILQVRDVDTVLSRIKRNMYVTEETLHEYTAAIPREHEKEVV